MNRANGKMLAQAREILAEFNRIGVALRGITRQRALQDDFKFAGRTRGDGAQPRQRIRTTLQDVDDGTRAGR